jgi:hypothetical protein
MATGRLMHIPGMVPPRGLTVSSRGNGKTKSLRSDVSEIYNDLVMTGLITQEELGETLQDIARQGAEYMKELIATRSTGWGEFMRSQGLGHGEGRNRTGQMSRDVTYRAEVGPKKQYVRIGWIRNYEDYYGYQETGFRNFGVWNPPLMETQPYIGKTWQWTEGMFALFDTREYVKNITDIETRKMKRRIVSRMNKGG